MSLRVISRILGILLMLFSLTLVPPMLISRVFEDDTLSAFAVAMGITLLTGFALFYPNRHARKELRNRDGFLITVLFWTVLGAFGSLPFLLAEDPNLTIIDAMFESFSGLTTTGATVMTGLDLLPHSILYYRQQLQWLGGMGIVVLAVAILPTLGIGGMQLYRTEIPGPLKDSKLTPRITETAKALWYIYAALTLVCFASYWAAGMSWFDALGHSFSTVAVGGFSTHDASIGYFDSASIEMICVFFMVVSSISFGLHFAAWREGRISHYLRDPETRFFLILLLILTCVTIAGLLLTGSYDDSKALRHGLFEAVSVATTTGFGVADFTGWPGVLPMMLFIAAFIGACSGSAGGGMKVIRILLILKQGVREIHRLIHPNAILSVKVGKMRISEGVAEAVWGFFSVYLMLFVLMMLGMLATGLDQVTAWSAVGSALNNLGPGLGEVATHYGDIPGAAKGILILAMLLGRLEIFTILVLFTPAFWRR
ncbi:MAG: potassium transporter [Cobetia sp.]|jgi:trk system potassium uptake protein TrkH|uniref:Trk system potassium uptake protein n=1 Tax=Cobetia amphilecti TaxID=1055104 RepID=A0AAP4TXU6_9GAMM|nr:MULTISPECIES: TrkH family potassium uptake protein [Cobetia]AVV34595.1 potassium transporter [Halomonas sp. SF2003]MBR9755792.1 potassium transporter [Gammaproteobacteria bacterium]NVN57031.1 potassium transporter [bacterium Scap17]TCJ27093.1 potassium transporter [Halomonas sp. GDM18]KGA02203.1 potassium transporter [Cobetia amphilecti]|tara:strand:- start:19351 stop:20799 length:1449 start_codon:yes stop_codon:yes gene_type:complete